MIDVCVIGGGPVGLFSAYYCQSRDLQTLLVESGQQLGGRIHLYAHLDISDVPYISYELQNIPQGKQCIAIDWAYDAMQAANQATQFLRPEAHYQPVVSTHDPVFKGWT